MFEVPKQYQLSGCALGHHQHRKAWHAVLSVTSHSSCAALECISTVFPMAIELLFSPSDTEWQDWTHVQLWKRNPHEWVTTELIRKTLMLGGIGGRRRRGRQRTRWLDGITNSMDTEFEWTLGVGDGQGGLACCNSWGRKESGTTERLNLNWRKLHWWSRCFKHNTF